MEKRYNLIRISAIFVIVIILGGCVSEKTAISQINWFSNLEDAKTEAQIWKRPVFVNFTGSDWCGWCIKLEEEVFSKPEFIQYARDNLIMVRLDFPRSKPQPVEIQQYNQTIAQQFGIKGFPTILLLDMDGKEIVRTGYQYGGAPAYVQHIKELLEKI